MKTERRMKMTSSHFEKRLDPKTKSSPEISLTDWDRIDIMRDEDIILDDEHPELTEEAIAAGQFRHVFTKIQPSK
jgi:hypothetical protein